jgi:hypothetical protein
MSMGMSSRVIHVSGHVSAVSCRGDLEQQGTASPRGGAGVGHSSMSTGRTPPNRWRARRSCSRRRPPRPRRPRKEGSRTPRRWSCRGSLPPRRKTLDKSLCCDALQFILSATRSPPPLLLPPPPPPNPLPSFLPASAGTHTPRTCPFGAYGGSCGEVGRAQVAVGRTLPSPQTRRAAQGIR